MRRENKNIWLETSERHHNTQYEGAGHDSRLYQEILHKDMAQ